MRIHGYFFHDGDAVPLDAVPLFASAVVEVESEIKAAGPVLNDTDAYTADQHAQSTSAFVGTLALAPLVLVQGQYPMYYGTWRIWKDAAGTVPVTTIGDIVRRVDSLIGSHYVYQDGAESLCPTWGGREIGLIYDGTDDHLIFSDSWKAVGLQQSVIGGPGSTFLSLDLQGRTSQGWYYGFANDGATTAHGANINVAAAGEYRMLTRADDNTGSDKDGSLNAVATGFFPSTGVFALGCVVAADSKLRYLATGKTPVQWDWTMSQHEISAADYNPMLGALNNRGTAAVGSGRVRSFVAFDYTATDANFTNTIEPELTA